jgi:hypothetical protein
MARFDAEIKRLVAREIFWVRWKQALVAEAVMLPEPACINQAVSHMPPLPHVDRLRRDGLAAWVSVAWRAPDLFYGV